MKVPTFSRQLFVNKDGNLESSMQQVFDVLFQQMQSNLSNGLTPDSLTTSEINNAADPNNRNTKDNGTIWYDSDAHVLKAKINGVVKTFSMV